MAPSTVESATTLGGSGEGWAEALRRTGQELLADADSARRYLLLLRFVLLNGALTAGLVAAWQLGWLEQMVAVDNFHIVKIIAVVFLIGLYQAGNRIMQLTYELNGLAEGHPPADSRAAAYLRSIRGADGHGRSVLAGSLRLKLATRLGHIRFIASTLVMLGLIGTVIGFIVALSGVDPDAVGNTNAIGPMVSTLLLGMGMAMYKTLAGIVFNIWLMLNYRLLEQGTVHFFTQLIERGERQ